MPAQNKTETNFFQEKVPQQITDCQKEKCESWEGDEGDEEERQEPGDNKRKEKPVHDDDEDKEESVSNQGKEVKKGTNSARGFRLK